MSEPKFKEGAWVKKEDGTKGMTVVRYTGEQGNGFSGKVICKYSDEDGNDIEGEFDESQLVAL